MAGWKIYFTHCVNNASDAHTHIRVHRSRVVARGYDACVCVHIRAVPSEL